MRTPHFTDSMTAPIEASRTLAALAARGVSILVCAHLCTTIAAAADFDKEKAIAGWRRLEAALFSIHASAAFTSQNHQTDTPPFRTHWEVNASDGYARFQRLDEGRTTPSLISCANRDYTFGFRRRLSDDIALEVRAIESAPKDLSWLHLQARRSLAANHTLVNAPLSAFWEHGGFDIRSIHPTSSNDGETTLRCSFTNRWHSREDEYPVSGTIVFAPAEDWAIRHYEATVVTAGGDRFDDVHVQSQYIEGAGWVTEEMSSRISLSKEEDPAIETSSTVTVMGLGNIDPRECMLATYGFPEPVIDRDAHRPWLWVLTGGLMLLAIGVLLLRAQSKHNDVALATRTVRDV